MTQLEPGTRVVSTIDYTLGTILSQVSPGAYFVKWDKRPAGLANKDDISYDDQDFIPHQKMKAMFKHGPKITKRGQLIKETTDGQDSERAV